MTDFTKEGRVRDKVSDYRIGSGVITDIRPNDTYPIKVNFENNTCTYTADGRDLRDNKQPTLTFANGSFIIDQGTPPSRELEIDWQRVIDGEFDLGFSDVSVEDAANSPILYGLLGYNDAASTYPYTSSNECNLWKHCSVPNKKGIRKPHFGGKCPTDHTGKLAVKNRSEQWFMLHDAPSQCVDYDPDAWVWADANCDFMEYIELP